MSEEAPRVELNTAALDFDLSAPVNQFQQTTAQTPEQLDHMAAEAAPHSNGTTHHDVQQSASQAKDSLLESKVSVTRASTLCRDAG